MYLKKKYIYKDWLKSVTFLYYVFLYSIELIVIEVAYVYVYIFYNEIIEDLFNKYRYYI